MYYKVFSSNQFDKKILNSKEIEEFEKFVENLKKGIIRGKPLGYSFFKEKKIRDKRIYFLIYVDIKIILLVNASNKKYQKSIIKKIKLLLNEYREFAYYCYKNY